MAEHAEDPSFRFFPDDYRWSHGLLGALNSAPWGGAEIGEVNRIGMALRGSLGDDLAWFRAWAAEADRLETIGRRHIAEGHRRSGAHFLFRASNYALIGERFLTPKIDESNAVYRRAVANFRDAAAHIGRPRIEPVEIPYEGTSLPGLLVHPDRDGKTGPAPAMVYFDGLDITKEIQYFKGVPELAARGIAVLLVDGPGNGEAIRFRGLTLHHETERYATAAYEFLAARNDIDPHRIGVMAISLGGYYAPRAAAFEQRFACCFAWGAQWDYHAVWKRRFDALAAKGNPSLSVPAHHVFWILGVNDQHEALERLRHFRLDGVVQRIECPFLLLHGAGDEQIPLAEAQLCFDKVGSRRKTFRVFTREEGGFHHCQIDNLSIGVAAFADWLEDVLRP